MARRVNDAGIACIKQWEGKRLTAYRDSVGVWTIGYGHTSAAGAPHVSEGMTITETQAEDILRRDLAKFEARVERLVTVPLSDNQFTVLVSFDLNTGRLDSSSLLKKLNKSEYDAVPGELMRWVNAGGRKLEGLVNRRAAECGLWAKGGFVSSAYVGAKPQPVAKATQTPEGQGATLAGIGVLGTACSDAANQLAPFTEALPLIRWLFIGLTITGISFGLYATIRRIRAGNA